MARYKFFLDMPNGETFEFARADYREPRKLPFVFHAGSWVRATRVVKMKQFPIKHECDARCTNANGRTMNCECSCGGKNHGKGSVSFVCDEA